MQQRRVVDAGARRFAHQAHWLGGRGMEWHGDLLYGRDARALADDDAQIQLFVRVAGLPFLWNRHAVIADLHDARRATHAQDADVVARLVAAAGAHERGRAKFGRELVGERGELVGRHRVDRTRIVDLAPRARRIQQCERLVDRREHRAFAMVASGLALAVRAAAHVSMYYKPLRSPGGSDSPKPSWSVRTAS